MLIIRHQPGRHAYLRHQHSTTTPCSCLPHTPWGNIHIPVALPWCWWVHIPHTHQPQLPYDTSGKLYYSNQAGRAWASCPDGRRFRPPRFHITRGPCQRLRCEVYGLVSVALVSCTATNCTGWPICPPNWVNRQMVRCLASVPSSASCNQIAIRAMVATWLQLVG